MDVLDSTPLLEEKDQQVVLKKGKTIFDYIGHLPDLKMSIEEIRERAIREAAKDHDWNGSGKEASPGGLIVAYIGQTGEIF